MGSSYNSYQINTSVSVFKVPKYHLDCWSFRLFNDYILIAYATQMRWKDNYEWWVYKYLEQGNCGFFDDTMWKFAWRDRGEEPETCIRITGILYNIDTRYLTNKSLQHYHCLVHSFFRNLSGACVCSCACQPIS